MKITPVELELDLLASDLVRSPGLHMSAIYGPLYQTLQPKRYGREGLPAPMLMALGSAWEKHLEYLLLSQGHKVDRPGEFRTKEGIAFSPDLLVYNGVMRTAEVKLTWMTDSDDLRDPKFAKYHTQLMSYGYNLESPYARLYAAFVNGKGGKGPPVPTLRAYDIEYSKREMENEWRMMMNFAKQRKLL